MEPREPAPRGGGRSARAGTARTRAAAGAARQRPTRRSGWGRCFGGERRRRSRRPWRRARKAAASDTTAWRARRAPSDTARRARRQGGEHDGPSRAAAAPLPDARQRPPGRRSESNVGGPPLRIPRHIHRRAARPAGRRSGDAGAGSRPSRRARGRRTMVVVAIAGGARSGGEMADAPDLGSGAARRAGSSPAPSIRIVRSVAAGGRGARARSSTCVRPPVRRATDACRRGRPGTLLLAARLFRASPPVPGSGVATASAARPHPHTGAR